VATPVQARAFLKSLGLHALVLAVLLLLPAGPWRHTTHPDDVEVVFHHAEPPPPPLVRPLPAPVGALAAGPGPSSRPAPKAPLTPVPPKPLPPGEPIAQQTPDAPSGPVDVPPAETPQQRVGKTGLLAFKDQIASAATDKTTPQLGTGTLSAADDTSRTNTGTLLAGNGGGSGGIDLTGLSRQVGGGGGGGSGGGMRGVAVGRATSSIAGIGGGGRALGGGAGGAGGDGTSHGNPGNARTDEEIQIVFDRHKASFYRLYHAELRNDPTLRGQMVLKLTIEPDGRVSMCMLQSSDMKAPDLAAQVVSRVREINFGAKEGVRALTIVYPIDFLPAA
jgi:hypothetical protein